MANNSQVTKRNSNLWDGKFKDKELKLYSSLKEKDIELILKYQKQLPILQDDSIERIDGRILFEQLKLTETKTKFSDWIKSNLENIGSEINEDYSVRFKTNGQFTEEDIENMSPQKRSSYGISQEYFLTIDCAKEIAMVTGATPRINKETKELSKMTRKYFIAIEKAFKERYEWNKDRQGSINEYYNLRQVVFKDLYGDNYLGAWIPKWWNITETKTGRKNTYAYEMYRLDLVIIGMSAQEYRRINNLNKGIAIRNTFSEKQLEDFELLQSKSAEYLAVNKIWNTEERIDMVSKFYEYYKNLNKGDK